MERHIFVLQNKRIIKRTGTFKNSYISYSLRNIGMVQIKSGMFDINSATLLITIKDFYTENSNATRVRISSLNDAYEEYNIFK